MSVLIVTYDLNTPGQKYKCIMEYFSNVDWIRLSESCYAIETDLHPEVVFKELGACLDENDSLLVVTATKPFDGYGPKDAINWLDQHLPPDPNDSDDTLSSHRFFGD